MKPLEWTPERLQAACLLHDEGWAGSLARDWIALVEENARLRGQLAKLHEQAPAPAKHRHEPTPPRRVG